MPERHIIVCHPNEKRCRDIMGVLQEHNPELELSLITDLRQAAQSVEEEDPAIVVVGVDAADDPSLKTVERLGNREGITAGIMVVSEDPSRDLLVATMRAGCDEFLEYPIDPDELEEALSRLYKKRGLSRGGEGQVTAVYSAKGGTGNTTLATNLVALITRSLGQPNSACILDIHAQMGDVALMMDIQEFSKSVADVSMEASRLDGALLQGYMTSHDSGADVLPAPLELEEMDEVDPANLIGVIEQARSVYQHVILDIPHQLDTLSLAGLDSADQVFVVCDMLLPTIHNTKRTIELLQELEYSKSKLKLIINRYYESDDISIEEISQHVQLPVYWLIPYDSPVAIQAANEGQTVDHIEGRGALARSLVALAQDMAGVEIRPKKKKKFGLFGWR